MIVFLLWTLASPLLAHQLAEIPDSADTFAIRTALVSVTDANGIALRGLGAEDFQVEESGVRRDVVDAWGETRQEMFLLVDTSAGFRGGISSLRKGVEAFAVSLTEPHEVLLAAFGGAVYHVAGPTSDPEVLVRATPRLAASMDAMYLLDAMAHVCSGVAATPRADAEPPVAVIVTALTPDASLTPLEEVYRLARESGAVFYVLHYDPPQPVSHFEERARMENFLATLAQSSGGRYVRLLATAALPTELGELGNELMQPRYHVSFLTEVEPQTRLENLTVRVARDGARAVPIRLLRHEQIVRAGSGGELPQ